MHEILVVHSATQLDPASRGRVVVCASHGGLYPAWLAAHAGVRGVILHDAGIGRHSAGIAGVLWLGGLGIAACAVDYRSACIGDSSDVLANGVVSTVNDIAAKHGCLPGHTCEQAARCFVESATNGDGDVPAIGESRRAIPNTGHRAVWALDSVALAREGDRRGIIVTGSHGGLLGGRPDQILEVDVFAAFFNDAGGGKDEAGFRRLPILDERGTAAATVSHQSARIGDGQSTYETGVLSRVNETAARHELRIGMTAREAVARLVGLG
ncbi:MAG TPA: hypothetical protein VFP36_05490 [Usitatibacter sp.]|nr:hypothetical protein [Usitatibacter sp.]